MTGLLSVIPTPIGNLGDMPPRALEALRTADVVLAEDTRVTGKLLSALGVTGKPLERLDENLMAARITAVVSRVAAGEKIAYCSDAGMPGVSDPGLRLVKAAREAGVPVEVLPGPTAVATAYVASGTSATTFYFGGFFPRKDKARRDLLGRLGFLDAALIFYESPNRLVNALISIADFFPAREVTVCRELTKLHEEIVRGPAGEVRDAFAGRPSIKGELVIVIDPPASDEQAAEGADVRKRARERARELAEAAERPKSIARQLAAEFGLARNEAYAVALASREDSTSDDSLSAPHRARAADNHIPEVHDASQADDPPPASREERSADVGEGGCHAVD